MFLKNLLALAADILLGVVGYNIQVCEVDACNIVTNNSVAKSSAKNCRFMTTRL